jgi:hypothetical protein
MARNLNVPMWGIVGDSGLNELAGVIAELRKEIKIIEEEAIKKESEIEATNQRLNMYIKTILDIEEYDNSKDLLIINEKNEACIYPHDTIESEADLINLPPTDKKYKITYKQAEKIKNYMESYSYIVFDYEDLLDSYDDLVEEHEELWSHIHNSLEDTSFFQVHDSKKEQENDVEMFNKKKHLLFIVKEETGKWGFKYIRKKDENKFYKMIDEQKGEEA